MNTSSAVSTSFFARLMGACEPGPHGRRDSAMLWLAYTFALSPSQVTHLRHRDLLVSALRLPKGVLPLSALAWEVVDEVFSAAREAASALGAVRAPDDDRLVHLTPRGARLALLRIIRTDCGVCLTWPDLRRAGLRRMYVEEGYDAASRLAACVGLSLTEELLSLPVTGGVPISAAALPRVTVPAAGPLVVLC